MKTPFHLQQSVVVYKVSNSHLSLTERIKHEPLSKDFYFGEIVAINNETQVCIQPFELDETDTIDMTLHWINLETEPYCVIPLTSTYCKEQLILARQQSEIRATLVAEGYRTDVDVAHHAGM